MPILMCKNEPVYNETTNTVLNEALLPKFPKGEFDYNSFKRNRYFSEGTNGGARALHQQLLDLSKKEMPSLTVDMKLRFCLSDCYWFKYEGVDATWESRSPYINDFSRLDYITRDSSAPTIETGGSFNKRWVKDERGNRFLIKTLENDQIRAEIFSSRLAEAFSLNVQKAFPIGKQGLDGSLVALGNITDTEWMLLPYSIVSDPQKHRVNGKRPSEIVSVYDDPQQFLHQALEMVLFDAIVMNQDRANNMGNLAIFKHSETGEVKFPPLFDFNLAKISPGNYGLHQFLVEVVDNLRKDNLVEDSLEILRRWNMVVPDQIEKYKNEEVQERPQSTLEIEGGPELSLEQGIPYHKVLDGFWSRRLELLIEMLEDDPFNDTLAFS